jgi:hypothetical protein
MAKREPSAPFEELLEAAEHDARVTVWEQTFVASIREQIEKRDQPWLSDQQSRVLARIALKMGIDLPPQVRACRPLSGKQRDVLARIAAKVGSPFTGDDAAEAVEPCPV